jgi:hypothetical protein
MQYNSAFMQTQEHKDTILRKNIRMFLWKTARNAAKDRVYGAEVRNDMRKIMH